MGSQIQTVKLLHAAVRCTCGQRIGMRDASKLLRQSITRSSSLGTFAKIWMQQRRMAVSENYWLS